MRNSRNYLRPVITAILFPIVLLGIMWSVDSYAQWRAERLVNVSREQAIALAWSQCFSKPPQNFPPVRWAYARLNSGGWTVMGNQTYFGWLRNKEPSAIAWVSLQSALLIDCRFIGPDW